MTERKRIVVDVRIDGTIMAATQGIAGPACLDEADRIAELCGEQITSSALTADYVRPAVPVDLEAEQTVIDQAEGS
jgi:hypothetical protein